MPMNSQHIIVVRKNRTYSVYRGTLKARSFFYSVSSIHHFPVLDVHLSFIPQKVSCSHSRVLVFIYYCLDTSVGHLRLTGMLFFLVQGSIFRLYIPLYALLHDRDDTLNDVTDRKSVV